MEKYLDYIYKHKKLFTFAGLLVLSFIYHAYKTNQEELPLHGVKVIKQKKWCENEKCYQQVFFKALDSIQTKYVFVYEEPFIHVGDIINVSLNEPSDFLLIGSGTIENNRDIKYKFHSIKLKYHDIN